MSHMFFLWGRKSSEEKLDKGYFNCPHCRQRTPAVMTRHEEHQHIYFIPIRSTVGPEMIRCEECLKTFANTERFGYDFGPHQETPDWKCFKCGKPVPYLQMDCPHCGFRFTGLCNAIGI